MTCNTPRNQREYEKSGKRKRGPSHPQVRPNGRWLAESVKPNGGYVRSYHDTSAKAHKRLAGVPLHHSHKIVDTQPLKEATSAPAA